MGAAGHPNAIHVAPTFSPGSPTSSIQNIAIVNSILYFAGIDESAGEAYDACVVVAIRGIDGTHLWEHSSPGGSCGTNVAGYDGYINGADAVLIGKGMVYVSFIEQGSYLDAFNAATGTMIWSHTGVLESVLPGAVVLYENPTGCEVGWVRMSVDVASHETRRGRSAGGHRDELYPATQWCWFASAQ